MLIPHDELREETLRNLIEEFVSREGTEYGVREISISDKVRQVQAQLANGSCVIIFDAHTETSHIVTLEEWKRRKHAIE
jgi:uncharacterized protein YheU (UPF0270 family)